MANSDIPSDKREFRCNHCDGKILIPRDLPPTTGPCPHCSGVITSPALERTVLRRRHFQVSAASAAAVRCRPPHHRRSVREAAATVRSDEASRPTPHPLAKEDTPTKSRFPHASRSLAGATSRKPEAPLPRQAKRHKSGLIPVMLVLLVLILGAGAAVYFVAKEMGRNVPPPAVKPRPPDPGRERGELHPDRLAEGRLSAAARLHGGHRPARTNSRSSSMASSSPPRLEDFYGGGVINDSDTPADAFSIYELSEEDRKRGLFMMIYDQPPQFDMKEFFRPLAIAGSAVRHRRGGPAAQHAGPRRKLRHGTAAGACLLQTHRRTDSSSIGKSSPRPNTGPSRTSSNFPKSARPVSSACSSSRTCRTRAALEAGTRTYRVADPANTGDTARVNVKVDSETGRALSHHQLARHQGKPPDHPHRHRGTQMDRRSRPRRNWKSAASSAGNSSDSVARKPRPPHRRSDLTGWTLSRIRTARRSPPSPPRPAWARSR